MKFFGIESAALALGLAGLAQAHMEMTDPAPFKSKANPHANGDVDYSMTAPLEAGGGNFPCKGYHSLFGTPAGASVADWKAGGSYSMTITGGANHGGGSCQASLSFDKGETWKVIHSYVGNCPGAGTTSYDFKVPADTPSGEAIFAWTWFNQIGNREMYMNCAAVTIGGGSSSKKRASALSSRPSMFVANVNNGCSTEEGSDLEFPDPGPDTSNDSSKTAPPKGSCASGSGSGSGGGSSGGDSGATPSSPAGGDGSGNGNNGAAPSSPAGGDTGAPSSAAPVSAPSMTQPAAEPSQPAAEPTQPAAESSAAGGAPSQVPGGVFITVSSPAEGTEAPVAAPTDTMMTLTKSAPGTGNEPMPTSVVQPEPVPTTPAGTPEAAPTAAPATPSSGSGDGGADSGSGSGDGQGHIAGTACTTEGEWNCIGGSKYQRCASGRWSVVQSMASGTTCSGSKAMAFAWGFGRKLALRARRA